MNAQAIHPRLDRADLLVYRDGDGKTRPIHSSVDWQKRRDMALAGMEQVMGPLPGLEKCCGLDLQVEEETDCGSYVRRFVTYQSEPASRVPAYLLLPKSVLSGREQAHAVLCLHPTDDQVGHKVVVGLGGRTNRQYAQELAERGFVTLAPAYPLLANYQPDLDALGYQSGTMKAIWDNIRGIDLLESLPQVKPGGVGVIGHSLGGHNGVYTAVFDQRIRVVVTSCGLDSYVDYKGGKIRGWTSTRYMPRLREYEDRLEQIPFDFQEMIGALAPRHCLIIAPLGDTNFQWQSVDRIAKAASQVYRLCGHPERLRVGTSRLRTRLSDTHAGDGLSVVRRGTAWHCGIGLTASQTAASNREYRMSNNESRMMKSIIVQGATIVREEARVCGPLHSGACVPRVSRYGSRGALRREPPQYAEGRPGWHRGIDTPRIVASSRAGDGNGDEPRQPISR